MMSVLDLTSDQRAQLTALAKHHAKELANFADGCVDLGDFAHDIDILTRTQDSEAAALIATFEPPPTLCQHPGCTARAEHRFTLRLKGGRVVRYCLEHWQARMQAKAGRT